MGESLPGTSPSEYPLEDRLDSWKEIAAFLKRDVTTVQRWEKREGMPVHRHLHDRLGSVYASRAELHAWTRSRKPLLSENGSGAVSAASVGVVEEEAKRTEAPDARARGRWGWLVSLAVLLFVAAGVAIWLQRTEYFWKNPIAEARFQAITDFDGIAGGAAISRDGNLVAFLSDRDGPMDVWVTQVGSGEYHNLTHGSFAGLGNPALRTLAFSPDGSLVTFWLRRPGSGGGESTATWAVPVLGGQPRPYLEGVAEFDWARVGGQLAFHTSAAGDPLFVSKDGRLADASLLFTAAAGLHSHFPLWSPDGLFLYFVQGTIPDKLDIWRIASGGGTPERITSHNATVMYPVNLHGSTLLYLATDAEGSGPWLYSVDVNRRIAHRLTSGPERYTSLSASADGRHLAVTVASPKRTLWRLNLASPQTTQPTAIALSTGTGFSPRLGPGYLLYVSTAGSGEGIWKFADGTGTQLWHAAGAHFIGSPAISADGRAVAFSVRQDGRSLLYVMQADGAGVRVVADGLELEGSPAWSPDGRFLTTAAKEHGIPHLVQVAVDGRSRGVLVAGYALDPAWSPDGRFALYSGPDIGTTFAVKGVRAAGGTVSLPSLTLTRGARHLAVLPDGRSVVFLQGDIQHKNLWQMDLESGEARQLTDLPSSFDVGDFGVSPDGREVVLERVQERSEVMMVEVLGR